jgi:hypothetical protein
MVSTVNIPPKKSLNHDASTVFGGTDVIVNTTLNTTEISFFRFIKGSRFAFIYSISVFVAKEKHSILILEVFSSILHLK